MNHHVDNYGVQEMLGMLSFQLTTENAPNGAFSIGASCIN